MLHSTHYAALGLDDHERAAVIHSAYRDLARRYHPARIGPGGEGNFRSIADAYRVLSDSSLRRSYDDARARAEEDVSTRSRSASRSRTSARAFEPELVERHVERRSLCRAALRASSAGEEILERFARNFSGVGVPKSESADCLHVRLLVATRNGPDGVQIQLDVPVLVRCGSCAGHHAAALARCPACDGYGFTESERTVTIFVVGESPDARTQEMSLAPIGIHNFYLHVAIQHALTFD